MKTNIETEDVIASYEDSQQKRNEVFEAVLEMFTMYDFSKDDIIETNAHESLIEELYSIIGFTFKYKDEDTL